LAVTPDPRHRGIFRGLCVDAGAKGNLVPNAFLAAMAIESGCEWVTTNRRLQPIQRSALAPSVAIGWRDVFLGGLTQRQDCAVRPAL
jgi:hypothetical protein